jgi:hypothetical protein
MNHKKEGFTGMRKSPAIGVALLVIAENAMAALPERVAAKPQANKETPMTTTQSKFFCNTKALTPDERAHHKQLSDKLMAAGKAIVETAKGYELQFSPQNVTLAELADWVVAESKCCPFLDSHIDLENKGHLLCLRLTGEEGVKQFIRAEFALQ